MSFTQSVSAPRQSTTGRSDYSCAPRTTANYRVLYLRRRAGFGGGGSTALVEADSGQPMVDQTGVDVHERGKYSEDHRKHRDVDGDASKEMPVEHAATLTRRTSSGFAGSRNLYHATSGRGQAAVFG